jgi:peptide/nickel transport system ATP-binding protein/oligopeptide transport system ATP-binding protein
VPRPLLEVEGLTTVFASEDGQVTAVDDVSFAVAPGEVLGIVGESGSGKSVTALSVMRLVPRPPGRIVAGEVRLDGENLLALPEAAMRQRRGCDLAMIFQEPMTALNPVFTVGEQLIEGLLAHERVGRAAARARAVELLAEVGIAAPAERLDDFPHRMSGGMRQRVMIAMALACRPKLLLADEPTTALDVTIQAQILDLLRALQTGHGMAVVMITHNMGVVVELAHRVAVMYCGRVVEEGSTRDVFTAPAHPYTKGLLASIPSLDDEVPRLTTIPGVVPPLARLPPGCRFAPRCAAAAAACRERQPALVDAGAPGHRAACIALTGYRHEAAG